MYSAYSLCQWLVWLTDCLKLPLISKQTNNTWNSKNKPVFESLDFRITFLNFYLSFILSMRKNPQNTSKLRIWFRYIFSFHQQHNIHKVHFYSSNNSIPSITINNELVIVNCLIHPRAPNSKLLRWKSNN